MRALVGFLSRQLRARPLACASLCLLLGMLLAQALPASALHAMLALVAVGGRIHWVCGYGISQEVAVKPDDEAVELQYHDSIQRRNDNAQ